MAWKTAHQLNLLLYKRTASVPNAELFGLTSQIRRAGVSITANLAEGRGRGSDADFARFLFMATGSACKLESQLELAKDLKFLPTADHRAALDLLILIPVNRMLTALIRKLSPLPHSKLTADS